MNIKNMNKEDFVTCEQAVALKELGFKEECLYHYDRGTLKSNYFDNNVVFTDELYNSYNIDYQTVDTLCDAPTLAQVQKWLKLEYNHYIEISYDENLYRYKNRIIRNGAKEIYRSEVIYNSPEEALSNGITECIKILDEYRRFCNTRTSH